MGNDVDYSQRTAADDDDNDSIIKTLKQLYPWGFRYPGGDRVAAYQHIWGDPESEKKLREILSPKSTAERAEEQRIEEEQFSGGDPLSGEKLSGDPLSRKNVEKWNRSRKKL